MEDREMRGDFDEERLRRQEEILEREDRLMAAGGVIFNPAEKVVADVEWLSDRGDSAVEVTAGSVLLGGGGPILVGAGVQLPTFVELPRPWWCRQEASG